MLVIMWADFSLKLDAQTATPRSASGAGLQQHSVHWVHQVLHKCPGLDRKTQNRWIPSTYITSRGGKASSVDQTVFLFNEHFHPKKKNIPKSLLALFCLSHSPFILYHFFYHYFCRLSKIWFGRWRATITNAPVGKPVCANTPLEGCLIILTVRSCQKSNSKQNFFFRAHICETLKTHKQQVVCCPVAHCPPVIVSSLSQPGIQPAVRQRCSYGWWRPVSC